ncbi:hypothetical protein OK016_21200 [Vibrio chagasii]|nr:hypothetical protein [Vibrio chagasii]
MNKVAEGHLLEGTATLKLNSKAVQRRNRPPHVKHQNNGDRLVKAERKLRSKPRAHCRTN